MVSNQEAAASVAQETQSQAQRRLFDRTRNSLSNSARSLQMRKKLAFELELLSDRALADIGLWRCDIPGFARNAAKVPGSEPLAVAIAADFRCLWPSNRSKTQTSGRWVAKTSA